tara:strand:+ start:3060 stop:4877 length:1818 start_codon:yes stop_codon:yes gene_type:complete
MAASSANLNVLPLDGDQSERLDQALSGLSPDQLHWISGYAAGLAAATSAGAVAPAGPAAASDPANSMTVLYGSQTGNGEAIATELAEAARNQGFAVNLTSLAEYKPSQLKREQLVSFVISTHGEGEPPDDAELFHEFLLSAKAPKLEKLKFAVLALGDSSYVNFCQTGREFDERLHALGGTRLAPIVECDVDYEEAAQGWVTELVSQLPEIINTSAAVPQLRAVNAPPRFDKHHPFAAEVLVNQKITSRDSSKDVRHIELSLEGSGLQYEPGDAIAVQIENPPALVSELLDVLGFAADTVVAIKDESLALGDALLKKLEITAASLGFLQAWANILDRGAAGENGLRTILESEDRSALTELVETHQVIDIVRRFPATTDAQTFVDGLRKLSPRSYSIASSQRANPDEVHLTVAAVRYTAFGSEHWGAASTHLADRLEPGSQVSVFVEPNSRFHLPANDNADVIMIGPGTGVAPFRAFVEERDERGAAGNNWLFFGDRNFSSDFLYQLEWQRHLKQGRLARLDLAFSRDQAEKIYVQDRIRAQGADVWAWLQRGAYVYVCGDAKHMANDVDSALVDVIETHAGVTREEAVAELKNLRRDGRYQRDVY